MMPVKTPQILVLALWLVCWGMTVLRGCHMFQLNSYKPSVHLRWLRRNFAGEYLRRYFYFAAILVISLFIKDSTLAALVFIALCSSHAVANRPRKAKKPLVYTNRVKRMIATNAALTAAALAASLYGGSPYVSLSLWLLAAPLVMLLSNAINAPVERAINRRYTEDARRILKGMPGLTVIGVTGSYGKTSTKYFLQKILSSKFNVLMTPESYNTPMGVVKTIRTELKPFHDVFICEMGARNVGDIKELCGIVNPDIGVITSIGPQHLESFGSIQNIARAKFELADALLESRKSPHIPLFVNFDNSYIRDEIERRNACGAVKYGLTEGCDYTGKDVSVSSAGSTFTVAFPDKPARVFSTKLLGRHNVTNIIAALAVADCLGVDDASAAISVGRLEAVPHRLQLINRGDIIIIDDAYNSNEAGAEAALEVLSAFDGFKILVTPGMVELGVEQERLNRRFGEMASAVCDFVALVGHRATESVLAGLKDAAYPEDKIFVAADLTSAFLKVNAIGTNKTKVVLIENDLPDNYLEG
jgi:UDP-N-acetylmuramoyl-tripeptide--D-alanyl-D-alanine ligase